MDREATDELVKSLRCGSVLSTSLTYFALPTYVLLSLLWCVCVICLIVKIEPNMLFCCHMSCCLTSRGTMDWLSQNDSKQSITYNQVHSKRQKLLTINSFKQINWYKGITIHHQINELLTHSHGQVGWSGRFEARMMDSDGHDTTWSSELNTSF